MCFLVCLESFHCLLPLSVYKNKENQVGLHREPIIMLEKRLTSHQFTFHTLFYFRSAFMYSDCRPTFIYSNIHCRPTFIYSNIHCRSTFINSMIRCGHIFIYSNIHCGQTLIYYNIHCGHIFIYCGKQ